MQPILRIAPKLAALCATLTICAAMTLMLSSTVYAGEPATLGLTLLFAAPQWAIGYALVALGVLLGLIPICWPSRRKAEKKQPHEV